MKGHFNILPHEVNKKACPSRPGLWTKGKNMSPEIQSKFTGFELYTLQDIEKLKTRTLEKKWSWMFCFKEFLAEMESKLLRRGLTSTQTATNSYS